MTLSSSLSIAISAAVYVVMLTGAAALATTLFAWLLPKDGPPRTRILVANGLSLLLLTTLASIVDAQLGAIRFVLAFGLFLVPQLIWLVVGLAELRRRASDHATPAESSELPTVPREPSARGHLLVRFWRGELSLPVSYWLFGLGLNVLMAMVTGAIVVLFPARTAYDPTPIFWSLAAAWGAGAMITVFQVGGVWRSATRYARAKRAIGRSPAWAYLAKAAFVLAVLRFAVDFVGEGLPQLRETYRMAFLGDPDLPDFSIRVMRDGTEAEIIGGFKFGLTDEFSRIVKASPRIGVVHLTSDGGRIGEAEKLNALIREHWMRTYVPDACHSACTVAFAAGRERWLARSAQLGFHSASFPGLSAAELAGAADPQRSALLRAGVDGAFIDRALATPSSKLWTPSADELLKARVVTAMADGSQFALSGSIFRFDRAQVATLLARYDPILAAARDRMPAEFDSIVDAFLSDSEAGRTETAVFDAVGARSKQIYVRSIPMADDATLLALATLVADQLDALRTTSPAACYSFTRGALGGRELAALVPKALIQRESVLSVQAIQTASSRPSPDRAELAPLWEKVTEEIGRRLGPDKVELLLEEQIPPAQFADYCDATRTLYRQISRLGEQDGAALYRMLVSDK